MKAVTVGGAMIDAIAVIDDDRIERGRGKSGSLLIEGGKKVEAQEISHHTGGGGVNTAIAMARLGVDVSTILKLGKDDRAETILRRLSEEGVSTRWAMRDDRAATGSAIMIAAHERDAGIFTFRGANTLLAPEDLKPDMLAADLVYIAGLSNDAANCFPVLVDYAKKAGATVATNPGIRQLTRKTTTFFETIGRIDILSLNRVEASALVPQLVNRVGEGGQALTAEDAENPSAAQTPDLAMVGFESGGYEMSLAKFCEALHGLGVGHVLITDGKRGAYASGDGALRFRAVEKSHVVGTAGAGDAFASTFAAWLTQSGSVEQAMDAATFNAASVIGYVDTQTGLMSEAAMRAKLKDSARGATLTWRSKSYQRGGA